MELNSNYDQNAAVRRASVNGLAVVGFITLVFVGIYLAVSAAQFIPNAVTRLASASVFFSSIFTDNSGNQLEVVPGTDATTTTTLPIAGSTATPASTGSAPAAATPTAGTKSYTSSSLGGSSSGSGYTGALTGKADLIVNITAVGYLTSSGNTDSFVEANTIPKGKNGAVQFTVTNAGTNIASSWKFHATLPNTPTRSYTSPAQASLNPAEHIDFTLGFDRVRKGDDQKITIEVDSTNNVNEISERNNEDTDTVDAN